MKGEKKKSSSVVDRVDTAEPTTTSTAEGETSAALALSNDTRQGLPWRAMSCWIDTFIQMVAVAAVYEPAAFNECFQSAPQDSMPYMLWELVSRMNSPLAQGEDWEARGKDLRQRWD